MISQSFKNAITKVLEAKMILILSILITVITTGITTVYTQYITKKTVAKHLPSMILQMTNKTHTTINIVNDILADLVGKCGDRSGGAWAVYDEKTKILKFFEVFENYHGAVVATRRVDGNDFYRIEHELDVFAYEKIMSIHGYEVINMQDDLWLYSKFFQSLKKNIWKITNIELQKLKMPLIVPKNMYLSIVRLENELIYIFGLTVSQDLYCNVTQTIATNNEKMHYTGVELQRLAVRATDILNVFETYGGTNDRKI